MDKHDLLLSSSDNKELNSGSNPEDQTRELESRLKASGLGFFHLLLLTVVGLAIAADASEVFSVSFVLPIAEHDLNITTAEKGWLIASVFVGMLLGGYVWGSFADVFGRKKILQTAMLWNGIFGLVSAFSPNFGFFLFCRLSSGIGIGGSQPVVFSYTTEFFTEKQRRPVVVLSSSCWLFGVIFPAVVAWALMGTVGPASEISFYIGSLHFVHWRLFLIICSLPAFVFSISLSFFPESPAYLFNKDKPEEMMRVLQWVQKVNNVCPCCVVKQQADSIPLVSDQTTPEVEHQLNSQGQSISVLNKLKQIWHSTVGIFRWKYLRATVLLVIIWFTQCFGYYGLELWFPEFFKRLQMECVMSNSTLNCSSNETNLQFYQDTLYTALASLPGSITGILLIIVLGGRIQLALTLILSAVSVFTLWGVPSNHAAVVGVSCLFSAISVNAFGALSLVNIAAYDVELRSTAFGVHSGVGRVGAILGNVVFGHLLDVDRGIPILIVASLLTTGAICAILLPPIYRAENRPPLERLLYRLGKKLKLSIFLRKKS